MRRLRRSSCLVSVGPMSVGMGKGMLPAFVLMQNRWYEHIVRTIVRPTYDAQPQKGASGCRYTASLKRCPDTNLQQLSSQRGQDILPRRVPGGREASQQAHDHGKDNRCQYDAPSQVQTENGFAEGELVADSGSHAVEGQDQDDPNDRPQQGKEQGFNHERCENAGP